jgi:hydrogenase maturation protease
MTTVIGIGNRDRGDDAAGLLVTDRLRSEAPPGVSVVQLQGDPMGMLDNLQAADRVVIVDAVGPAGHPGRVHRLVATERSAIAAYRGRSTHGLGASDVLQLAVALGSLPEQTVVYGIEGEDFELGHRPTPVVCDAVARVVARIREEVR